MYEPSRSQSFDAMVAKCQSRLRATPLPLTSTAGAVHILPVGFRRSRQPVFLCDCKPALYFADSETIPDHAELVVARLAVLQLCENASLRPWMSASEKPLSVGLIMISGAILMRLGDIYTESSTRLAAGVDVETTGEV